MDVTTPSCFTRMPQEILSLIFIECLSIARTSSYENYLNQRFASLYLASVSRFWRYVACSTPALWSTCWLSYNYTHLNTIWLERAGMRLLDIDGSLAPSHRHYPSTPLILSIKPFMDRCRSFSIDHTRLARPSLILNPINAPNLVSCNILRPNPPIWLTQFVRHAQKLRHLKIRDSLGLDYDYSNLRSFQIRRMNCPEELSRILSTAVRLQKLVLRASFDHDHPESSRISSNDSLVTLQLRCESILELAEIFRQLSLPSLKTLRVRVDDIDGDDDEEDEEFVLPIFCRFLQRSQCRLTSLTLRGAFHGLSLVHNLLSQPDMGSLEATKLVGCRYIKGLVASLASPSFLPHLRRIAFEGVAACDYKFGALHHLVLARRQGVRAGQQPSGRKLEYLKVLYKPNANCCCLSSFLDEIVPVKAIAESTQGDTTPFTVEFGGLEFFQGHCLGAEMGSEDAFDESDLENLL